MFKSFEIFFIHQCLRFIILGCEKILNEEIGLRTGVCLKLKEARIGIEKIIDIDRFKGNGWFFILNSESRNAFLFASLIEKDLPTLILI